MAKNIDLSRVPHGSYIIIANQYGCSAQYVGMVARGIRRNVQIEMLLTEALKQNNRQKNKLAKLRQQITL